MAGVGQGRIGSHHKSGSSDYYLRDDAGSLKMKIEFGIRKKWWFGIAMFMLATCRINEEWSAQWLVDHAMNVTVNGEVQ